jgi:Protein of unknown function (DUF3558)
VNVAKALLVMSFLFVSACAVNDDSTQPFPVESVMTVTSDAVNDVPLPFENRFPNRKNLSNDGTTFEPCVAFTDEELTRYGVDPTAVEDAAQVDGQGIRGCAWFMPRQFSLGVVVTNAESLERYKTGKPELDWETDILVDDRLIAVARLNDDDSTCMTYIQSMDAVVVIDVVLIGVNRGEGDDPCRKVVDFTSAYLDKIPE